MSEDELDGVCTLQMPASRAVFDMGAKCVFASNEGGIINLKHLNHTYGRPTRTLAITN